MEEDAHWSFRKRTTSALKLSKLCNYSKYDIHAMTIQYEKWGKAIAEPKERISQYLEQVMDLEAVIREYASTDFPRVRELILKAENFGESFLEAELLNIKKNTSLGLGKVFAATLKTQVIGYISLGRRIFALMVDSIIVDRNHQRKGVDG